MEKGKGTGKHRDTGRQHSDPEEGKTPGSQRGGRENEEGRRDDQTSKWTGPRTRRLTWAAGVLSSDHRQITPRQIEAEVDRTAGGSETWVKPSDGFGGRCPAICGRYTGPQKYEFANQP